MLELMTHNWWIYLIRGVAAILFGVVALVWPSLSLGVLVLLFGFYTLIAGIFTTVGSVANRQDFRRWWLLLIQSLASITAGLLTFIWPGLTALVLLTLIAAWAVVTGVLELAAAIELRKALQNEWWLALSGVLSISFGVLLIAWPAAGLLSLVWLIGLYTLTFGIFLSIFSFQLRRVDKKSSHSFLNT